MSFARKGLTDRILRNSYCRNTVLTYIFLFSRWNSVCVCVCVCGGGGRVGGWVCVGGCVFVCGCLTITLASLFIIYTQHLEFLQYLQFNKSSSYFHYFHCYLFSFFPRNLRYLSISLLLRFKELTWYSKFCDIYFHCGSVLSLWETSTSFLFTLFSFVFLAGSGITFYEHYNKS